MKLLHTQLSREFNETASTTSFRNQPGHQKAAVDTMRRKLVNVMVSAPLAMTVPSICVAAGTSKSANQNVAPGRPALISPTRLSRRRKKWPREDRIQSDLFKTYGDPLDHGTLVKVHIPWTMRIAGLNGKTRRHLWAHHKVAGSLERVLRTVHGEYGSSHIRRLGFDVFGGDHVDRKMRGSKRWSLHAWGIAFDFDPQNNGLRWDHRRAKLAHPDCEDWWRIWESEGWYSLGRNHDYDWMHVQAAWRN